MFKISLKDVGPDRVTKDINTVAITLDSCLVVARKECDKILGYPNFNITSIDNLVYVLTNYHILVGSFTITNLH